MSKILYKYDPETFEYLEPIEAQLDPIQTRNAGEPVYAAYENTTDVPPPEETRDGMVVTYHAYDNTWVYTPDNRETQVINVETKEQKKYGKIGSIDFPYSDKIPDANLLPYLKWEGGIWTLARRTELLDDIWSMRKRARDRECQSDLEYNEHLFHVDAKSLSDILLAAQSSALANDMESTRTWVTADSVSVQVTGNDLVAILRLYGARRERLVMESNAAWQEDVERSDSELLALYREMTGTEQ